MNSLISSVQELLHSPRWSLTALTVALFATMVLGLGPAARAASSDASAITGFLTIGFANVDSNFSSIRGAKVDVSEYVALKWPDRTHFQSCHTWHFEANKTLDITEQFMYSCNSTPRSVSRQALFDMAASTLRARLPSDYTSKGPETRTDGNLLQIWSQSGKPDVKLWAFANNGKPYYELSMVKNP
jgi:hypothetical protein